jgi:hypothetical protein
VTGGVVHPHTVTPGWYASPVRERPVRQAAGPILTVPTLEQLIVFLDRAIAQAHKQGNTDKTNDLLERRHNAAELHTFLQIVEPYLGGTLTDGP